MKAQTKAIVASVVVIALALTAVSGVTYSWFSDSESTEITVDIASFDVKVEIQDPTSTGIAVASKVSNDKISVSGLAANTNISIPYSAEYKSNIKVVYRTIAVIESTGTDTLKSYDLQNIMVNNKALSNASATDTTYELVVSDWIQLDPKSNYTAIDGLTAIKITTPSTYGSSNGSGGYLLPDGSSYTTGDWSPGQSKQMKIIIKTELYQGDYPTSTLKSGKATISANKVVSGSATIDADAKAANVTVDLSQVGNVTGTIDGSSQTVDVTGLEIGVTSTTDSGFSTSVGAIDLALKKDGSSITGANFDSPVTVTAVFTDVTSDPGVVQVMYGAEPIETISYNYDPSAQTLTVVFKTTHFSKFTVVSAIATVGNAYYASLNDAITAANDGDAIKIIAPGTYKLPDSLSKKVTIDGISTDKVIFDYSTTSGNLCKLANGTAFDNISLKLGSNNYTGFQHATNIKFTNCDIAGVLFCYGTTTFEGCTFNLASGQYVWTYGADVSFDRCTFNTAGKAILIYNESGHNDGSWSPCGIVSNVSVTNCTFNATAGATATAVPNMNCAAVEIDNSGVGVKLTLSNNNVDTAEGKFSGQWRIKIFLDDGDDVIVNGTQYTSTAVDGMVFQT